MPRCLINSVDLAGVEALAPGKTTIEQNECRSREKSGPPAQDGLSQGREQTDNERHERFTCASDALLRK